jgi:Arc/MetJ-type ribon-helix-helix transcriptional regulator
MMTSFELENLEVPDELKTWVRSQVTSGRYATETRVIVEALELLFVRHSEMDQPLARLAPDPKLSPISEAAPSIDGTSKTAAEML